MEQNNLAQMLMLRETTKHYGRIALDFKCNQLKEATISSAAFGAPHSGM